MYRKLQYAKAFGGGEEDKAKTARTVTNKDREEWNKYVDYLRTKGVAGNPDLDKNGLGFKYLDEYVKANPSTTLNRDVILPIQKDLLYYST